MTIFPVKTIAVSRPVMAAVALLVGQSAFSDVFAAPLPLPLVAHEVVYDLALVKSRKSPSVEEARGRIAYGFSGNACDGYKTEFRQVSEVGGGEGTPTASDLRSTSLEGGEGQFYSFKIMTKMNGSADSTSIGEARRTAGGLTVKLKEPEEKTLTFSGDILFPTQQMKSIIAAAKDGKSLLEQQVYDGSDGGEKLYKTLAVIGKAIAPGTPPSTADVSPQQAVLAQTTRWPVTVSYYDAGGDAQSGEQTPVYALSFEVYENGVSRALKLDYNDFVLGGTMTAFKAETKAANAKPDAPQKSSKDNADKAAGCR